MLVQASQYYSFAATILLAMGLVFQVPVVILGPRASGLVTPRQLRKNRRYAILACAAIAAFLPGDAITLLLETVPLYVLYEASILVAALVGRSSRGAGEAEPACAAPEAVPDEPAASRPQPADPTRTQTVQQIIDHVDSDLSLMLFDLRGRGRRRTVRVIYIGLALLIGVGLVGFGVGGGFGGGGLLNAATNNEGARRRRASPTRSPSTAKLTQQQPHNVSGLGKPDQNAAARSRRGSLQKRQRDVPPAGQEDLRRSRRSLEPLRRAQAEAPSSRCEGA